MNQKQISFCRMATFFNCLGDAMPLAMANGLNSNIVVFRSTINLPINYISPCKTSTNIIVIAYTDCGPGHYDSALYVGTAAMKQVSQNTNTKCRCGVNAKDNKYPACVDSVKRHSLANVLQQENHVLPHVFAKVVKIPVATMLCLVSVKGKYMCGRHTILQVQASPWTEV